MNIKFTPQNFCAPRHFASKNFCFTILNEQVAELDYQAVMSSQKSLVGLFGPTDYWPQETMTLAENRASLRIHQQEFDSNKAFAYSVLTPTKDKCLGSVYIDNSRHKNYDAEVYFWLRDDARSLEDEFFILLKQWLKEQWPFDSVIFPGRDISWHDWALAIER